MRKVDRAARAERCGCLTRIAGPDESLYTDEGVFALLKRLGRVFSLVRRQRGSVAVILVLGLLTAGLGALEPLVLKMIIDGLGAKGALAAVLMGVGLLLGLGLVNEASGALANWLTWRTRLRFHFTLLDHMIEQLHRLESRSELSEGAGAVMTRLDRSIQGLINALSEISFKVLPAYLYLAIAVTVMLRLDWRLTLITLALTPGPVWIAHRAAPKQRLREKVLLERWAGIYGRFSEVLSGLRTVRSFAMEDAEKERFMGRVVDANGVVLRGVGFDSLVGSAQNLIVLGARIACLGFGGWLVLEGRVTVGTLVAFLGYLGGLFGPVQSLTGIYRTLRTASACLDHVLAVLDIEHAVEDAPDAVDPAPVGGHVVFEEVHFGYDPDDRRILEGISFEAFHGRVTAIVGPSGSGKSTMMTLLQRFHDPCAGRITLDGRDLRALEQKALRRQIGVVLQDAMLFNEPVRDCIAYGRPEASEEEVVRAAKAANAHEFIMRLEKGYESLAGERGNRFSVGERQRIAIARAILRDPAILILDEATSALDAETEFLVQDALGQLVRGRTTFVIAHRLATVVDADVILVLKDGRIVEQGNHGELLRMNGYYASLVRRQTAGLLAEEYVDEAPEACSA